MRDSNDYLIADARELLNAAEATAAFQHYRDTLPLGHIWASVGRSGRRQFVEGRSSWDAITKLQEVLFVHNPSRQQAEWAVRWHLDNLARKGFPLSTLPYLGETAEITPEDTTIRLDGKRHWHDDFRHIETMLRIKPHLAEPGRIVELGAGTGGLARILKAVYPKTCYIIIDLPDTLVFSMMFLRHCFPEARWQFLGEGETPDYTNDFVFCPVGMETVFHGQSFDAFINTASLGEMRIETVRHWFAFVQERASFGKIFSVNRFLNTAGPVTMAWRHAENLSALAFDAKWKILDWEVVPDFLRCPWQNRHARQTLIFAERTETPQPIPTITPILNASWNSESNEMSVWAPAFNEDLTLTGSLFKLWEAHRLDPGARTKDALKLYLKHLRSNGPDIFEEEAHL